MAIIAVQEHYQDLKNIFDTDEMRNIARRGIIHVGADIGQEVPQYLEYGFKNIVLIEANPKSFKILQAKFGHCENMILLNYAVCESNGAVDFHIHTSRSGNAEPASVLPMKRFSEIVKTLHTPETIRVPGITLDSLVASHGIRMTEYNVVNIDIQGAELLALRGATKVIAALDAIISEVNLIEMYENGALEDEIVAFLGGQGFEKRHAVYHTLYDETSTFPAWGECLFVRRDLVQRVAP